MGWIYTLAVECGNSKEHMTTCSNHFEAYSITLDKKTYKFKSNCHKMNTSSGDTLWVEIFSEDLPTFKDSNPHTDKLFNQIGKALIDHLIKIHCFRFAIPGVESLGAIEYEDFNDCLEINKSFIDSYPGLVISNEIANNLKNSNSYQIISKYHVMLPI